MNIIIENDGSNYRIYTMIGHYNVPFEKIGILIDIHGRLGKLIKRTHRDDTSIIFKRIDGVEQDLSRIGVYEVVDVTLYSKYNSALLSSSRI